MKLLCLASLGLLALATPAQATWVDYEIEAGGVGTTTFGVYPYQTLGTAYIDAGISLVFDTDQLQNGSLFIPGTSGSAEVSISADAFSLKIGGIEEYSIAMQFAPGSSGSMPNPDFETRNLVDSSFSYHLHAHHDSRDVTGGSVVGVSTTYLVSAPAGGRSVRFGTNATPTPEPGTWATMLIGFGAIGGTLRRRRTAYA